MNLTKEQTIERLLKLEETLNGAGCNGWADRVRKAKNELNDLISDLCREVR
jgi:hypothetical protein